MIWYQLCWMVRISEWHRFVPQNLLNREATLKLHSSKILKIQQSQPQELVPLGALPRYYPVLIHIEVCRGLTKFSINFNVKTQAKLHEHVQLAVSHYVGHASEFWKSVCKKSHQPEQLQTMYRQSDRKLDFALETPMGISILKNIDNIGTRERPPQSNHM